MDDAFPHGICRAVVQGRIGQKSSLPIQTESRGALLQWMRPNIKIEGKKQVFVWSANRRGKVLAVKATGGGRTELEDIFFLKDVLKYCSKKETNPSS
jgi:hypothetical protein